jgi:deoxyadenosine/deoxycytidine kinase
VADFLLEKDPLFAALTLDDEELKLYRQIYASLAPQAPDPDLVILLEAQPDTLIERIARRGRPSETAISEPYLRELCDAYTRFFYQYNAAPLLIVNTEHLNLVDSEADFLLLVERIGGMRGRREYFNRVS